MKILFDLQHPAHLHFFRNVIGLLREDGHAIKVTARHKDILVDLAREYGFDIEVFGVSRPGVANLAGEFLYREYRLNRILSDFRPDCVFAIAGTYASVLARIRNIPVYIFYDTEHAVLSNLVAYPFATCIYVPRCYRKEIRWNHVRYNGYHELAYLHPNYFRPDDAVLKEIGVQKGEIFTIVRFVGWAAMHDVGRKGFSEEKKIDAVNVLEKYGKVFITCEGDLPWELERYRLRINVSKIHHAMAFSSLIFGESATMASEGAVLGVPGIFLDPVGRGYTDEQEREYHIVSNFTPGQEDRAIERAREILENYDRNKWKQIGEKIIHDKVDVTRMMMAIANNTGQSDSKE